MTDARQRWRVFVARGPGARDALHRDVAAAWEAGLTGSGLPLVSTEGSRPQPRLVFAAPVPVGMLAEREPMDLWLLERRRIDEVRAAVEAAAPAGHRVVELYDVWVGAPSLPASVVAGDYVATVRPVAADQREDVDPAARSDPSALGERVAAAVAALLAEPRVERRREKGGGSVVVDIRPHVVDLAAIQPPQAAGRPDPDAGTALSMRLLLGGERGVGRPDEVVAAIAERLGMGLAVDSVVRRRVVLADDR
jgi:radical SAM-linked protein